MYVNPQQKVWAHVDRVAAWWNGATPAPVTIEWDLSNRCVLGCQDCHFAYTHTRGPWRAMPRALPVHQESGGDLADPDLVMRVLTEVKHFGVKSVVWTGGGEPTTHPQVFRVVDHAYHLGLQQGMYTLGGTLNSGQARYLAERLDWVVVSLDAADPDSYGTEKHTNPRKFNEACQAIEYLGMWSNPLRSGGPVVGVSFLLHEHNWMAADRMLALTRDLHATYATFRPTIRTHPNDPGTPVGDRTWVGKAMPDLVRLSNEPDVEISLDRFAEWAMWERHPYTKCCGVMLSATITPNGKVWICPNRRELEHSCLGDLTTETFTDIWKRHPAGVSVHPGLCRAMCKLHPVNQTLAPLFRDPPDHADFI